mgnify:CR=1 FL=1
MKGGLVGWLVGWLVGLFALRRRFLVGWLADELVGALVGLAGLLVCVFTCLSVWFGRLSCCSGGLCSFVRVLY